MEDLDENDDRYQDQQDAKNFIKFKKISAERFEKQIMISTVQIESAFSTLKFIKNRLRSLMDNESLKLNILGYLNKDWFMSIALEDVAEYVMAKKVFDE